MTAAVENHVVTQSKAPEKLNGAKAPKTLTKRNGSDSSRAIPPKSLSKSIADDVGSAPARDILVPLDRLVLSDANVRRVVHEEGLAELAALIASQGLLQRLSVVARPDGCFAVVAGGRRLRAMQMLAAEGKWDATQAVECKLYDNARAAEVSLAENSGREAMHPADEMEAFRHLVEQGLTVAQVAGRFGVSVLTVERRLRLARLAPRFLAMYRADEIEPDELQALALTDDHAAQESAWDGLPAYDRSAWAIRRMLTAQSCTGDSRLARFVGIATYEARGGAVRRDLFADAEDDASLYLDDAVLLQTLAMERLRGLAEEVRAEGWGFVDCLTECDNLALRSFARVPQAEREPTMEEAQVIDAMEAERTHLMEAYDRNEEVEGVDGDNYEAEEQRLSAALDALDDRLDGARAALQAWTPEQMASAGALLRVDHAGSLSVHRGLMRPEAGKAGRGEGGMRSEAGSGDDDDQGDHATSGGTRARPEFSEKLMRDLTAHRTAVLQAALTQNPQVALVTLVHRIAETVFGQYGRGNDVVKVTVRMTSDYSLAQNATDYENSPAGAILSRAETEWGDRLPGNPQAMFGWLLNQDRDTLLELLAYCTARSVDAVAGRERTSDQSDVIAEALDIDFADWWAPTAANYLGSVSKAKALEAVKEATGIDSTKAVAGMKKAEAIAYCATKLEGLRWLPAPLRARAANGVGDEDEKSSD